jgi:hypothetical protein
LFVKMKIAFSGESLMRLRMTYTNWPTVRSDGTRYLRARQRRARARAGLAQSPSQGFAVVRTFSCRCRARHCAQHAPR